MGLLQSKPKPPTGFASALASNVAAATVNPNEVTWAKAKMCDTYLFQVYNGTNQNVQVTFTALTNESCKIEEAAANIEGQGGAKFKQSIQRAGNEEPQVRIVEPGQVTMIQSNFKTGMFAFGRTKVLASNRDKVNVKDKHI